MNRQRSSAHQGVPGHLFRALGGAALALGLLCAFLSPARAAQTVTIPNSRYLGGNAYGNSLDGSGNNFDAAPNKNSLNINNGATVTGNAYGSVNRSGVTASANKVALSGGTVIGDVYGGFTTSNGNASAAASGNTVTLSGGTVNQSVHGGGALSVGFGSATASGNSVIINGGTVQGDVIGGYADSTSGTTKAINNTVTISGHPVFSPFTTLYGGYEAGDSYTGNTLNLNTKVTVLSIENFEYIHFNLPANVAADGGALLTVNAVANLTDGAGRASTITANTLGGTAPLRPGSKVTLIDASAGAAGLITNSAFTQSMGQAKGRHGATLLYAWALDTAGNKLTARVDNVQADPRTKALSEGFLSGMALLTQGSDLLAGQGMAQALSTAGARGTPGFGSFAAVSGGWSRYNTGSHVDMPGVNLIAGLSLGADLPPGRLTLGAFFEWGTGAYNSYNSFSHAADSNGDGNAYYLGGGVLGRMDFIDTGPGNFYVEGSFRAGGVDTKYNTDDLRDAMGRSVNGYQTFSPYYGIHAGLGYIWKITDAAGLELYGKYFWTRQQGNSVTLSTDDPVKFKDADSHRLRLGGRFAYAVNEHVSPYVGAAYEHEFDGRAKATTYGYSLDTPTLCGSTGIGELGVIVKPSKNLPLSFDLGVQGYVGTREGVTGSLHIRYEF